MSMDFMQKPGKTPGKFWHKKTRPEYSQDGAARAIFI